MVIDSYQREIDYLRLSVTDHCNLRCVYCVPDSFTPVTGSGKIMRDDEIVKLVSWFSELGISKIRITGGEPLVRPGISGLIQRLSRLDGISDVSLSTNGVLLSRLAEPLREAGLRRVNISLDTLIPERYGEITRNGRLVDVLGGIDTVLGMGFSPVKINVVVARGLNDDEIEDFAGLTESMPVHVRFIELMPMGDSGFFSADRWMPLQEMMERIPHLMPMAVRDWPRGHGPARYYTLPGGIGSIGFISALSRRFCASCNRVRLSSRGLLYPCLDSFEGTDMMTPIRGEASEDEIKGLILRTIEGKPEGHKMQGRVHELSTRSPLMCRIGG
jgi:cyclic pyranopterin phosphate synthase